MSRLKLVLSSLFTFISCTLMGSNTYYASKWEEVNRLMDQPLLKDAQKKVNEIRVVAKKENDGLNILKCEIYDYAIELGCEYDITSESKFKPGNANREEGEDIIIKHYDSAEKLLKSFKSPVDKSCCELFMAKMLMNFIDVMKRYPGSVPSVKEDKGKHFSAEDLREMSHENIRNLIRTHVDNIIKNKETLLSTSSERYNSLFVNSNDNEYKECRPSVFDAMLPSLISFYYENIELYCDVKSFYMPIHIVKTDLLKKDRLNSLFADVINYHNSKEEYGAALAAELLRLEYLESYSYIEKETRIETLNKLINQYDGKTSYLVDVVLKKQEIMCNLIIEHDKEKVADNTPKYPKQIIEEVKKYSDLYPDHKGTIQLQKNLEWLYEPTTNGFINIISNKGKDITAQLHYTNIDSIIADVYKLKIHPIEYYINNDFEKTALQDAELVCKKKFALVPSNYKIGRDTILNFGNTFDYGGYAVVFKTKKNNYHENGSDNAKSFNTLKDYEDPAYIELEKRNYFTISDLQLLNTESIGNKRHIFALDRETGYPIKNAEIERYLITDRSAILNETLKTSANGCAVITLPDSKYYRLHVKKGEDKCANWIGIEKMNAQSYENDFNIRTMTDRNIYRPGQTIEGKVILSSLSKNDDHVLANKKITLVFNDVNNNQIDKKDVITNEFGSAAFKFNIPTGLINGQFSITSKFENEKGPDCIHNHGILVESYKLPKAEASIRIKDGSSIMYGSKLYFEGDVKTFSGEGVGGTTIKYNIRGGRILDHGEVKCDDFGNFSIVTDSAISETYLWININAILPSGETTDLDYHFNMDKKPVSGYVFGNNIADRNSPLKISFSLSNNEKYNNDAEALLTIKTKEDEEHNIASKTWIEKKVKGKNQMVQEFDISSLPPTTYIIELKNIKSGEKIDSQELLIYDKTSEKLPDGITSLLWIPLKKSECSPTDDAVILIGSSEKKAKILAIVRDNDGNYLNEDWIDVDNGQTTYKVSYDKYFAHSDFKSLDVEFIIIRKGKMSRKFVNVRKNETKIKPQIEVLEIVRNIVPGEKQKIKAKIKPVDSSYEVAAVMVDKSLYDLLPQWHLLNHFYYDYYPYFRSNWNDVSENYFEFRNEAHIGKYKQLNINFLWDNISTSNRWRHGSLRAAYAKNVEEYSFFDESESTNDEYDVEDPDSNNVPPPPPAVNDFSDVKVRDNFVETAFFYPQLTTAADGSVEFEYTAPDALTAWRMIVFAHDKKVNSCITSEDLQTQMPFAVKASLPRFVRKGDKCSFATTITNNDEKEKSGDVAIIIKDVATDKIISQQSRKFSLDANKSKVEEWSFDVPAGVASIEVKMVGKSGTFSDGEVHQLPVLPDGTHVVKSKSMHVRGGETKDFSIDYNEKEMKDAEFTVEYTDNAVWQSLMALPSIKDAQYECATEFISSIYVNQLAQRIALLYPEIKTVVEEWQKEGDHAASPLDQDQDLKKALMKQTPWMCEAKSESEQRAKIVELYDKDRINKANKEAISKLEDLQQADGGFAWFSGFKSSEYVTVAVAEKMVEMREYGVLPKDCEKMLKKAMKYIDNALAKAYENEIDKKCNADREWVFDVLKIRISYDKKLDNNTKKILDYYVKKAHKEIKEMTLFGKASFAIVLNMKGDVKEAKSIVESLRQSATNTEELGMYWKGNQDSWGRYGNAIATHAMLTKAFIKTGCDAEELSDLRFHLITKKETTQWANAKSTLAAIDALVGDRPNAKTEDARSRVSTATIKIGGKQVDAKRTSGDGYMKIHYDKDNFTPELCNVHVEQPQGQEGIGGIYISYDAPYTEITSGKSGIEVKKKMYKVVIANDGDVDKEMLQEIKEGEELQKGDKVKIVITLRSDRDIDFVQVLDLRAACLEPVRKRPGIEWADGKIYYQSITDSEYSMFFDRISKGTRVFEYTLHVTQSGEYTQGITKVIPHYCPAFSANSVGGKVLVK